MANNDTKSTAKNSSYRGGYELKVIGDYEFDEVSSAKHKMIRRNQEYEA